MVEICYFWQHKTTKGEHVSASERAACVCLWWQTFMPALNLSSCSLFDTKVICTPGNLAFQFCTGAGAKRYSKSGLCRLYFKHLAHFTASTEQNYLFKWGTWKCLLPILKTEFLFCALCVLACCHVFHLRTSNRCNRTNVVDPQLHPPWGSWLGSAPRIALVEVPPHNWPEKYTLVSMFWFYSSPVDVKDLKRAIKSETWKLWLVTLETIFNCYQSDSIK